MEKTTSTGYGLEPPGYADTISNGKSTAFKTTFASVSMHQGDRIRLLSFPTEIVTLVRGIIKSNWPAGLQEERIYSGSNEFKLRGYPWYGQSDDAVYARRLMSRILEATFNGGWVMSFSTDVSKKPHDLDTLVFRHQSPRPPPADFMCISFSNSDMICFIDAPTELVEAFIREIQPSLQKRGPHKLPGCHELKMRGSPWYATGGESMTARALLLSLVGVLEQHGWTVYASIDQKANQSDGRGETDTWHCQRVKGWVAGMPIYHH